jgi:hypothetical protein
MKNSSDSIENPSWDIPVNSAVPQPLRHKQRAQLCYSILDKRKGMSSHMFQLQYARCVERFKGYVLQVADIEGGT